jgi:spore germination protein GerM
MGLKRKKRSHKRGWKKRWLRKVFIPLILVGIGLLAVYFFRPDVFDSLRPFLEGKPEKKMAVKERKIITLYFLEGEGEYLVGEKREILKQDDVKEEAKEAIHQLIKGPKSKLIRTLPPRTKLLTLKMDENGVARVDFSKTLSKDHPGGSSAEIITIYSIVNSLTLNFPQIKGVQILIEGEAGESIAGHLILDQPISSRTDLVKR